MRLMKWSSSKDSASRWLRISMIELDAFTHCHCGLDPQSIETGGGAGKGEFWGAANRLRIKPGVTALKVNGLRMCRTLSKRHLRLFEPDA